jgi:hypothetical protein
MALGKGTKLYKGTGTTLADATFTKEDAIANIRSIGEQTTTYDEVETTDLDSGIDKEFEPTLRDNGSIPISGDIKGENYATFKATEGQLLPWAIAHPTLEDINGKFMGWISEITRGEITPSENVGFTATIRISGAIEDFTAPVE